ncbi:carboxyl transferase domain-containing protein [Gorgonomyces haynaldii]|nr:carboxyl transferase domain-containing protein [Gorgonomyces haynaldii]
MFTTLSTSMLMIQDVLERLTATRIIKKVLIANSGMAAVKAIRSIRKWSYETFGDQNAIEFTVMCTPEDLSVNAEFIRMADAYVQVPGGSSNNNYANVDLIVDIAERTKVDAVWVGWGFASENPVLPDMLSAANIVFIGPPSSAMRALGDKIASTIVAQSANVPCVDWSGSGVILPGLEKGTVIEQVPEELYSKCTVSTVEQGLVHAERIGFPIMIKASEGGGGKGIRIVESMAQFSSAFVQVMREVPGSPIFVMKVVKNARHLEVQLLADCHGNAIALFGRDCSVQRRHQKILEEAPVSIAPLNIQREMEQAAVRLAKLVGYTAAGTVEYLYEPETQKFYFLELNPRLQVEHPTTEMVSGVNLPAAQLQVAMGIPLSCIKDIRVLYGLPPNGSSPIDFDFSNPESQTIQRKPIARGHVVAARITAENPDAGFKPNSGKMMELNFRSHPNVWGYFSVNASGGVHEYADSQFGHIFSYGESRDDARKNLVMALKDLSIRGEFRTTVEYLIVLLESETYVDNAFTTSWLDGLIASQSKTFNEPEAIMNALCGGIAIAFKRFYSGVDEYLESLEKGQSPSLSLLSTLSDVNFILNGVQFSMSVGLTGPETLFVVMGDTRIHCLAKKLPDGGLLVQLNGKSHVVYAKDEAIGTVLMVDGKTVNLEKENDPTKIRSPSPGKLVRYLVEDGDQVHAGDAIAEIEVMKMYMPLLATEDGVFKILKPAGSSLSNGDVIGSLILDNPDRVKRATKFDGVLPKFPKPSQYGEKLHQRFQELLEEATNILNGYEVDETPASVIQELKTVLRNPSLPVLEYQQIISSVSSRIPQHLPALLQKTIDENLEKKQDLDIPALREHVQSVLIKLSPDDQVAASNVLGPLYQWMDRYQDGLKQHEMHVFGQLFEIYYNTEKLFDNASDADVMTRLRDQLKSDKNRILQVSMASSKREGPKLLMLALMDDVCQDTMEPMRSFYVPLFNNLANLVSSRASKVSLRAREILISYQQPSFQERRASMLTILEQASKDANAFDQRHLAKLVMANYSILDILCSLFYHESQSISLAALYTYVLHTYQAYSIMQVKTYYDLPVAALSWRFVLRNANAYTPTLLGGDPTSARTGLILSFKNLEEMEQHLEDSVLQVFLPLFQETSPTSRILGVNVLNIAIQSWEGIRDDNEANKVLGAFVKQMEPLFSRTLIKRVTFIVVHQNQFPRYFTFRESLENTEDLVIRHTEPAMAHRLELRRLELFDIKPCFVDNRRVHIYYGQAKANPADVRFFIRAIVHPGPTLSTVSSRDFIMSEGTKIMRDILDAVEVLSAQFRNTDCNHVLLNFVPTFSLDLEEMETCMRDIIRRHATRLFKLRITEAEIRFVRQTSSTQVARPTRFIISSHSGFVIQLALYQEVRDAKGVQTLMSISTPSGPLHNMPVQSPHQPKEPVQPKRYKAHLMGTTYIYDFPELFKGGLKRQWSTYCAAEGVKPPAELITYTELVLNAQGQLEPSTREAGMNTCGMVAWEMQLFTPEYPQGRSVIVIGNDITFSIGSFGPTEDLMFFRATQWARERGIPRVYISANSGARIGLADEVQSKFKIAWTDAENPARGFEYLYLDEQDYENLNENDKIVIGSKVVVDGQVRYKLESVIGQTHGLGVENLQGSGQIAGETSRAYDDIFTITLVTCRSVGIGAYLVRLGQRTVQVEGAPIILTGAGALNKVYGREVYTSNLQLGGTQIMHQNGVSHLVVENDLEGVMEILNWLSFVPKEKNAPLPVLPCSDAVERDIDVDLKHDPRDLLRGIYDQDGWISGFFDKDSFKETLGGWAKGVVVGRARLGGIPIGCIVTETNTTEQFDFADPSVESSHSQVNLQAGQVWYPNSAFKTAQAIRDFNKGEQLPLIIFANWRGFAGGQSDMYKEILKFGSYIVDALSDYKQPVFIYLIGELRGGAWVVLDPTINPEMMEMYCSEDARGGVIEPPGVVEIKFRKPKILQTMERLDPLYSKLKQEFNSLEREQRKPVQAKIEQREKELLAIYTQAAVQFADLHDRPGRMVAKGVLKRMVPWKQARTYFYWRLLRRICELDVTRLIKDADQEYDFEMSKSMLVDWFMSDIRRHQDFGETPEDQMSAYDDADVQVVQWINSKRYDIEDRVRLIRQQKLEKECLRIAKESPEALLKTLAAVSDQLDGDLKRQLNAILKF